MVNEQHLAKLREGVIEWNKWRKDHPEVIPDLSEANLSDADLRAADLSRANLTRADLSRAHLTGVEFLGANLSEANLSDADLRAADLTGADLSRANLTRADLSGAHLTGVEFLGANLSEAKLMGADLLRSYLMGASISEQLSLREFVKSPTPLTTEEMKDLVAVKDAMKEILVNTSEISKELPKMIKSGLGKVQCMFIAQFVVGISLLIAAIVIGALGFNQILTVILGTTGGITLVTTLVTAPPMRLQNNRIALSQWLIAYENWYDTFSVISALMIEEAKKGKLDFIRVQAYNDYLLKTMNTILNSIQEMCKFQEGSLSVTTKKKDRD